MKTVSIALSDSDYGEHGPRTHRARALRAALGIHETVFYGIDARRAGLAAKRVYTVDGPPVPLSDKNVGTWLSHRALWAALLLDESETEFMILEDDALFPADWAVRVAAVLGTANAIGEWDFINIGPCCVEGKPHECVAGSLYRVDAMCLHAYIVRRTALHALVNSTDAVGCDEPIDISVMRHSLKLLRAFAVLPRIVEQIDVNLPK